MGQETMGPGNFEQIVEIDGNKYRVVDTGYTVREYYSHETTTKGPGPGWDGRWPVLEKYGVDDPKDLPDAPYYRYEKAEDSE